MSRKMVLGLVFMCMGFLGGILLIGAMVLSPMNPWSYNGITGWYGCLLGMRLQLPLGVCIAVTLAGFALSVIEAFRKE